MPFKKGQVANPQGNNSPGRKAVNKAQNALNMALEVLETNQVADLNGKLASELSVLLLEALRKDIVGAIKGLSPILPKDVSIDVTRCTDAANMTDEQLLDIIGERARMRHEQAKEIEGEIVQEEVKTG